MQFVEYLGREDSGLMSHQIGGRTYPVPCLVEDDDGVRLLLLPDEGAAQVEVPADVWFRAHADGASALVVGTSWVLAEDFIESRTENTARATYSVSAIWSGPAAEVPTFREMIEARREVQAEEAAVEGTFVHLHCHSEFSPLDGLSFPSEIVREAVKDGQKAVAVTDHGVCAAHPALQKAADDAGIKPIFGIEANFVGNRHERPTKVDKDMTPEQKEEIQAETKRIRDYDHLILWAMDDQGLRNLWAMSTEANAEGFYYRPRMDWDTLEKFNEGVMASTACLRGPITRALLVGDEMLARTQLARLMDIFGDRLYMEIHTNHLPDQIRVNPALVSLAREYDIPLIAAVDSHYPCKEDSDTHRVWIASQTSKDLTDDADLFAGQQDYHMLSEAEVREALAYLGEDVVEECIRNTVKVSDRCTARIAGATKTPVFSKVGGEQRDVERLVDLCMESWETKVTGKPRPVEEYMERFEREMKLLIQKSFCGYFLMVADYCLGCKDGRVDGGKPVMVGPGRGSGGGSLVGYLCGITDIDPVDSDLLFERFLTEGRTELPDFDVDFPASKRQVLTDYVTERYGSEFVVRVGTHIRLKNKGVFRDLARVLKSTIEIDYKDIDAISKIIDEAEADKAGLGMSWEDLMAQAGDLLEPYQIRYPMIFHYAERMVGRLKSYGKHAAGVVIATDEPLTGRIPMRGGEDDLIAEFDLKALESLGLVKFDLLTVRTLDTIQVAADAVRDGFGRAIDVYSWREEYEDPYVWEELSEGHTLGVFQIETRSGNKMTKRFKPTSLHELADVITLVRPGPMRSGLTETYLRRKAGLEPVTYPDPRLESVLSRTYGTILYQEDIMATCMVLAGYDSNEADAVRKILGKKQVEKVAAAGIKFVNASVERGMDRDAAEHLWEQMAEFAKYSFNRAHAYGYAVLGYWTAWFKFHYPSQYLSALMSTVDKGRIPEFVNEARRMGYKVLPPDINVSGYGFTVDGIDIRYGLNSVKGVGDAAVEAVIKEQPYVSFDDFISRKGAQANSGVVKLLASVGAFDSLEPRRKALERKIAFDDGESSRCVHKDETCVGPGGLPCTFDWANEPDPPMVRRRLDGRMQLVVKDPPKRCTTACRNFIAPTLDVSEMDDYTDEEIRTKELDLLGIHLSSTPFDVIPPEILADECSTGEDIEAGPVGEYVAAATVVRVKKHMTKTGKEMAFLTLLAQTSEIDVVVFTDQWLRFAPELKVNRLCFAYLAKNDRGVSLVDLKPLD